MGVPPHAKVCPVCKTPAPLTAQSCGICGHEYRTQFPGSPELRQPQAPAMAAPPAPPAYAMEEYIRQWATMSWYILFGLLLSATIFSLALAVYGIVQKQALRRSVAEMGINPDDFAREANGRFWQQIKPLVICAGLIIAFMVLVVLIIPAISSRRESSQVSIQTLADRLTVHMSESEVWSAIGKPDATQSLDGGFLTYYHTRDGDLRLTWTADSRLAYWENIGLPTQ